MNGTKLPDENFKYNQILRLILLYVYRNNKTLNNQDGHDKLNRLCFKEKALKEKK